MSFTSQAGPVVMPEGAPTPTQQVILEANRIEYVKDSLGRTLGVPRINHSLRRRIVKALSREQGEKAQYVWWSMLACSCVSINGERVIFPTTEAQNDALNDR